MQPALIKQKAIDLRKKGYSYKMILEKLNLPKSTLSDWLSNIPFKPNAEVFKRIKLAQIKSGLYKHNQKMLSIKTMKALAKKEVGSITKRDLLMFGLGVYFGEGSKNNEAIRIINSNPELIKIAVKWFEESCGIQKEHFKPSIHIYPDNDEKKSIAYWSKITGIPIKQFGKTQIDRRTDKSGKKKGRLPFGTMHLHVNSCGKREFGRVLHRKIMGWIEATIQQINLRV